MVSKLVSACTNRLDELIPNRCALNFNCISDSSPDAYSTLPDSSAIRPDTCNSKVDLPIPGSPPNKINAPGTIPPPRTRSISPYPEVMRAIAPTSISVKAFGLLSSSCTGR